MSVWRRWKVPRSEPACSKRKKAKSYRQANTQRNQEDIDPQHDDKTRNDRGQNRKTETAASISLLGDGTLI